MSPIRTAVLWIAPAGVLACAPGPDVAAIRDSVEAGGARFEEAFSALDAGAVAALYSEEAILLPPNAEPLTGRIPIRGFWEGVMSAGATGVDLTVDEVMATDSLAIEVGRYVISGAGGSRVDAGKYVVIWKREDGRWLLHRDIWNSSLPAVPPPSP